jgi:hypothetical protein
MSLRALLSTGFRRSTFRLFGLDERSVRAAIGLLKHSMRSSQPTTTANTPNKKKAAPVLRRLQEGNVWMRTSTTAPLRAQHRIDLNAKLDEARARLDHKIDLLQRSIDLREHPEWGLDLESMMEEVEALKRVCRDAARG